LPWSRGRRWQGQALIVCQVVVPGIPVAELQGSRPGCWGERAGGCVAACPQGCDEGGEDVGDSRPVREAGGSRPTARAPGYVIMKCRAYADILPTADTSYREVFFPGEGF
jgi:hypothetical protein